MSKEIEYPVYRRSQYHFYKVIESDDKFTNAIQVFNGYSMSIDTVHEDLAFKETEPIPEAEFLEVYYEVRRKLDDICLWQNLKIKIDK